MPTTALILALLAAGGPADDSPAPPAPVVGAVPEELRGRLGLDPFYAKHVDLGGFPVLGSARVEDAALKEAAYLVTRMLDGRDDLRDALAEARVRLVVMAASERTTDVPEHSDLTPAEYWDRRARGLGATTARPAVSCGEENLLHLPGDPYATENILIHEFAHAILGMGLRRVDPGFGRRLREAYREAKREGLWEGTYAGSNPDEYWAEAVQSWFDTNRQGDDAHNHVNTREELKEYDPRLAALVAEVFGDRPWRYARIEDRDAAGRAHLAGVDRSKAGRFSWHDRRAPEPDGEAAPGPGPD